MLSHRYTTAAAINSNSILDIIASSPPSSPRTEDFDVQSPSLTALSQRHLSVASISSVTSASSFGSCPSILVTQPNTPSSISDIMSHHDSSSYFPGDASSSRASSSERPVSQYAPSSTGRSASSTRSVRAILPPSRAVAGNLTSPPLLNIPVQQKQRSFSSEWRDLEAEIQKGKKNGGASERGRQGKRGFDSVECM